MYDELVRCLRHCVDAPEHRGCAGECKFGKEHPLNYLCIPAMMNEAADAIELQQKLLDGVSADNDSLCATIAELERDLKRSKEYETFWEKEANEALQKFQTAVASIPRWIPVTERLPDTIERVIATDGEEVGMAWRDWYENRVTKAVDEYWIAPNCAVNEERITHWMPLPSTEGLNET